MRRARAALVVIPIAALARTDCSIAPYCDEGSATCVDRGCADQVKSGDETDVDCGGSCSPCAVARSCAAGSDCATGRCVADRCCQAPCGVWASSYGSLDDDAATGVALAPDGSMYVVGSFSGIVDFGGGPIASAGQSDIFLVALDATGKHRWSTRFGGALMDAEVSLAVTPEGHPVLAITSPDPALDLGGGPLAGSSDQNLYLVELDATGKHVWSRAYTGAIDIAELAVAPGGDLLVTATFYETATLGAAGRITSNGSADILLMRLDPGGAPRWAKGWGDIWGDDAERVTVGADGSIYLTVHYSRSWSFGGAPLPDSAGQYSIGVAKLDAAGNHVWSQGWVNGADQFAPGILADDHGNLWIAGAIQGTLDVGTGPLTSGIGGSALVARLDAGTGKVRWAGSFGVHTMTALGIVPDGQGGAIVAGVLKGDADFGGGVALTAGTGQPYLARFAATGSAVWARALEGAAVNVAITAPPSGSVVILAGGYRDTLDIGTGPHASTGDTDAFVASLLP